jgi:hypothetical protein
MRSVFALLLIGAVANAQTIATRFLTPGAPIRITLSQGLTTTLLFPGPLAGAFGLGLVSNGNSGGAVQLEHPEGSNILVLHALSPAAHVMATVLLDGALYALDLESGPNPDVAITLTKTDAAVAGAREVTPEQVKAARPKYDAELLMSLLHRARDNAFLRPLYPDLYEGYKTLDGHFTSESGRWKTTVGTVHRFPKEDAIVLQGGVENETDKPLEFDGRAATVLVANEVHPIKLLDCVRPVPPHKTVPIDVVIQGDIDGGRANLSVDNEFRIMLPDDAGNVWGFKNGVLPDGSFKIPPSKRPVPLTQIVPKKEGQ